MGFRRPLGGWRSNRCCKSTSWNVTPISLRKSKVAEACRNWKDYQNVILKKLTTAFGDVLPADYKLPEDPNDWSYLDLFVAGYYWSMTNTDQKDRGRIAHRGKGYSETSVGLMDRCI